jgi:hypothetical protein
MTVLARPINGTFTVKSEKEYDFMNRKKDRSKINMILERAKKIEKNSGVNE